MMQASKTVSRLVWGSLRLTPISVKTCLQRACTTDSTIKMAGLKAELEVAELSRTQQSTNNLQTGISSIKYKGLEVEFTGSIDVSTRIGQKENRFYTSLLAALMKSCDMMDASNGVVFEAGNSWYLSRDGNQFVNNMRTNTKSQVVSAWCLWPVARHPSAKMIYTTDLAYFWKFHTYGPDKNTVTLEPTCSGRTDEHNWFVIDPDNTSSIAPYLLPQGYVNDMNPASDVSFSSLYVTKQFEAAYVVTVDSNLSSSLYFPFAWCCDKPPCPRQC